MKHTASYGGLRVYPLSSRPCEGRGGHTVAGGAETEQSKAPKD